MAQREDEARHPHAGDQAGHDDLRRRVEALEAALEARLANDEDAVQHELAQLYVASYQLHAASSFRDVVQVISEVMINLVGASRFALFLLDAPRGLLVPLVAEGLDVAALAAVPLGAGVVGEAAARRQRYDRPVGATDGPLAVLPLATADGLVGVLVLHELLSQKTQLVATDDELFTLLATHATTALAAALLREQAPPALRVLDVAVARALLA
jgi:hypothetical protein